MTTCNFIYDRIEAYIEGRIPPDQRTAISRHLDECPSCSEYARREQSRLPSALPVPAKLIETSDEERVNAPASEAGDPIPDEVVVELAELFPKRDFLRIAQLLDVYGPLAIAMEASTKVDRILAYYALYIAMRDSNIPEHTPTSSLEALQGTVRRLLGASPSVELRLANGICALMAHKFKEAHVELCAVTLLFRDEYLLAMAHFFSAFVLARQGFYENAGESNRHGCRIAERFDWVETIAAFEAQRAWFLFQNGYHCEALELVEAARPILLDAKDHAALGDLNFCAGRICKREGRDAASIEYLNASISEYAKFDPQHPAIGRAHLRLASVKLDMAGHLLTVGYSASKLSIHKLWGQANQHLDVADQIFKLRNQHRGIADVLVVRAALWSDRGDHAQGARCALDAYRQGQRLGDPIVIGRAAVELCRTNWLPSEQADREDVPGFSAHKALDWADRAVDHAERTQNRRLCAKAHIWRGLVLSGSFFANRAGAATCHAKADTLLKPKGAEGRAETVRRDNVCRTFDLLEKRLREMNERSSQATGRAAAAGSFGPDCSEIDE